MADIQKYNEVIAYRKAKSIDTVFLQEGGDFDETSAEVRVFSCEEKNGDGVLATYAFGAPDRTARALQAAFKRADFTGITGDGQNKHYTIIDPATAPVRILETPNYAASPEVSTFITAPSRAWVDAQPDNDARPLGAVGGVVGGKRLREGETPPLHITPNRRGGGYAITSATSTMEKTIREKLREPTEKRINYLGRRRPRKLVMSLAGANFDVYFWHSPLGGQGTLENCGLDHDYAACKGHASGGDVALIANILFANYLGVTAAFPANTLLLGDLNIDAVAVEAIYKTDNILSSLDRWCHAIAPAGIALTRRFAADFAKINNDYVCQNPSTFTRLTSDHAPVIFDI